VQTPLLSFLILQAANFFETSCSIWWVNPTLARLAGAAGGVLLQGELQHLAGTQGWQDLQGMTLSGGPHWVSLPHLVLTHALASHRWVGPHLCSHMP